jgi:hypothetical protein
MTFPVSFIARQAGAASTDEALRARSRRSGDGFARSFGHGQAAVAGFQVFAEVAPVMAGSANAITGSMTPVKLEGSRSSSRCLRRRVSQRRCLAVPHPYDVDDGALGEVKAKTPAAADVERAVAEFEGTPGA